MFIRCAFFQGNVKPGMEQAFNNYIRKELVPLWTRFPGAQEVRVLRQVESDVGDPHFGMVLSVRYPTRESIEIALASEVRLKSRAVKFLRTSLPCSMALYSTLFSAQMNMRCQPINFFQP
ncbi:MAG: hypothetical protein RL298_2191 [Pseudomonadota bacterium]